MIACAVGPVARIDLADIYRFTKRRWAQAQADAYVEAMFERFDAIARDTAYSRPSHFRADVWMCLYREHIIYWRRLSSGRVGIVTILHQHMVQADRVRRAVAVPIEPT